MAPAAANRILATPKTREAVGVLRGTVCYYFFGFRSECRMADLDVSLSSAEGRTLPIKRRLEGDDRTTLQMLDNLPWGKGERAWAGGETSGPLFRKMDRRVRLLERFKQAEPRKTIPAVLEQVTQVGSNSGKHRRLLGHTDVDDLKLLVEYVDTDLLAEVYQ